MREHGGGDVFRFRFSHALADVDRRGRNQTTSVPPSSWMREPGDGGGATCIVTSFDASDGRSRIARKSDSAVESIVTRRGQPPLATLFSSPGPTVVMNATGA
jgi:hypothetical protein